MEIYHCEIFSEKSNSVLQMWISLGHIFNPSKKAKQNHIDKIIYENREINDKQEVADTRNEYFCTIGDKLASSPYSYAWKLNRPISLLSSLDKIFEKIISLIFHYLQLCGFRKKKHSTTLALIELTDKIRTILDGKQYALGIYLDLKKEFDTVDHGILLSKLETYGFRGNVNDFIRSYLSNRKQFTIINGYCSSQRGINIRVPQGSVLGPLFSYFI